MAIPHAADPRRRSHARWVALALLAVGGLLYPSWSPPLRAQEEAASAEASRGFVQIILVRHAEKELDAGPDPALTEEGEARAEGLAALFAESGATHFFSSQFRRTKDTLVPWATAADADVTVHDARDAAGLVQKLRALEPGTVAAVAGHSNTVPDLLRRMGGTIGGLNARGHIEDDEYGRLFVLTLPVGWDEPQEPALLELRF